MKNIKKTTFYVGGQVSTAKYNYCEAIDYIISIGGNSIQFFMKSSQSNFDLIDEDDFKKAKKLVEKKKIFLIGHGALNLARNFENNFLEFDFFVLDMFKIYALGGVGLIVHIGSFLDMDKKEAFENIVKNVSVILDRTPSEVKLIFENMAGKCGDVGVSIEDLFEIYELFTDKQKQRIFFCLDSCHFHVAGFNIDCEKDVLKIYEKFNNLIGWDKVLCLHLNDARQKFNSGLDGHCDLGYGTINIDGLKSFTKLAKDTNKPLILETSEKNISYEKQISIVKSWN